MKKQKTPLSLLEDWIYKYEKVNHIYPSGQEILAQLSMLKPTEREMFKDFAIHRIYDNPKELDTEDYFNEHLTQD